MDKTAMEKKSYLRSVPRIGNYFPSEKLEYKNKINMSRRIDQKTRISIFAYLKNLKAPAQTHFLKHYL